MKKLISALAALLVLCFGMTGFAQPMPYTVTYNYLNGSLTIEGTTAVNDGMVTLEVLEKGNAFDGALSDEALKICRQTRAENGRYVFEIPFSCTEADTGEYAARLGSQSGDEVTELSLYLEPKENLANAYAGLEGAVSDFDTFSSYLDEHAADLNFGFALIDNGTVSASELKNYYDYVKSNPLRLESESDEQTNSRIFKTYAAAAALNKGAVSDMDRYIDEMYIEDEQFNELYDKYITTSSKQAYFTQKMSGKNIVGTDDFEKAAREALIFATIRYAGGSDDVKNVLTAYDSFIGIGSSMSDTACRGLMGRDFSSIQEIKSNYDALNTSRPATGGGSGGGFGGSGGGSGGWSNTGTGIGGYAAEPITGGDVSETLSVSFDDLDSVPWAAEAILALADKGIVNGVGFRP